VLVQDGAVANSNEGWIRDDVLRDYDKQQHPENDVELTYAVTFDECPIPDPETGTLEGEITDTQVCATLLSSTCSLRNDVEMLKLSCCNEVFL